MRMIHIFAASAAMAILTAVTGSAAEPEEKDVCAACHQKENPGLYLQWKESEHGKEGVGCADCHGASPNDVDAFRHHGVLIATLVTPNDCAQCHEQEAVEAMNSHHARAGEILESNDAFLAHVAGGHPAAITGCESCHGAKVQIDPAASNKLSSASWPNSGVGRLNPDGSKGACNACHSRHQFSREQARRPENCGKCHLGPDHPQKEIYEESKHGIAYRAQKDRMHMDREKWVVGVDYYEAPTCSTCHMSATRTQPVTHDVGNRISWTLRPIVSVHQDDWEQKRDKMKDVCSACHQATFVDGHYYQYDALVRLYNEKFAKPASDIYNLLKSKDVRERKVAFGNEVDWQFWELWHHEGRRARMGVAMMAPDYTWWHGIYDVAHTFYFKFIPTVQEYHLEETDAYIDRLLNENPMHTWLNGSTEELKSSIRDGSLQKTYEKFFE